MTVVFFRNVPKQNKATPPKCFDSYDSLARPTSQSQQFKVNGNWSAAFSVGVTYGLAGQVLTQTYPSGHTVNYSYDAAGRVSSFTGNLGEGVLRTYADAFRYAPSGGIEQERFGTDTALYHKQRFNARGQLWDMRLSTVPLLPTRPTVTAGR